jgi:hypothetical protein
VPVQAARCVVADACGHNRACSLSLVRCLQVLFVPGSRFKVLRVQKKLRPQDLLPGALAGEGRLVQPHLHEILRVGCWRWVDWHTLT